MKQNLRLKVDKNFVQVPKPNLFLASSDEGIHCNARNRFLRKDSSLAALGFEHVLGLGRAMSFRNLAATAVKRSCDTPVPSLVFFQSQIGNSPVH